MCQQLCGDDRIAVHPDVNGYGKDGWRALFRKNAKSFRMQLRCRQKRLPGITGAKEIIRQAAQAAVCSQADFEW